MKRSDVLKEGVSSLFAQLTGIVPRGAPPESLGALDVWGTSLTAAETHALEWLDGIDLAGVRMEVRPWPMLAAEANLLEFMERTAAYEGAFTGLHEVFAGLLPIGQGHGATFYLEAMPVRGDDDSEEEHVSRQVVARVGDELVICADSLASFVFALVASDAAAHGELTDEAWGECLDRLHRKVRLGPLGLGDLGLAFDEYESPRRDVEYWRLRSQWIVAALLGQREAATTMRITAPHPEVPLARRLDGSARYVPTAMYWMWRAQLLEEPERDALLAAAAQHPSRLVRDSARRVLDSELSLTSRLASHEIESDDVAIIENVLLPEQRVWIRAAASAAATGKRAALRADEAASDPSSKSESTAPAATNTATTVVQTLAAMPTPGEAAAMRLDVIRAEIIAAPPTEWTSLAWRTLDDAEFQTQLARHAAMAGGTAEQAQWLRAGAVNLPDRVDALATQLLPLWEALLVGAVARGETFIALPNAIEPLEDNAWADTVYRLRDAGDFVRARAAAVALVETAATTDELLTAHGLIAEVALAQQDDAGAGAALEAAADVLRRYNRRCPWDAARRGELADMLEQAARLAIGARRFVDAQRLYEERASVLAALREEFGDTPGVVNDLTRSLELAALAARESADTEGAHRLVDLAAAARTRLVPVLQEEAATYIGAILAARAERGRLSAQASERLGDMPIAQLPDPLLAHAVASGRWVDVWHDAQRSSVARQIVVATAFIRFPVAAAAPVLARAVRLAAPSVQAHYFAAWVACRLQGRADASAEIELVEWALRESGSDRTSQRQVWLAIAALVGHLPAAMAARVCDVARGMVALDMVTSLARDVAIALVTGARHDLRRRFADVVYAPSSSQRVADADLADVLALANLVPEQVSLDLVAPLATADASRVRRAARQVLERIGAPMLEQIPLGPVDASDWCHAISSECVGAHRWVVGAWQRGLSREVLRECEDLLALGRPLHGHEERFLELAIASAAHSPRGVNQDALAAVLAGYNARATKASDVRLQDVAMLRESLPQLTQVTLSSHERA